MTNVGCCPGTCVFTIAGVNAALANVPWTFCAVGGVNTEFPTGVGKCAGGVNL